MQPIYDLDIFKDTQKGENGRWTPSQKIFAIMLLDGNRKEIRGHDSPQFVKYSELLNIPTVTLKYWMKNKDEIYKESSALANSIITGVQMQLALSLPNIINKLNDSLENGKMKDSDKINLFRETVNKMRLLSNQSTANIEHNVNQFTPVPNAQIKESQMEE